MTKPRNVLLTVVLSICAPGLGHVYVGRAQKGLLAVGLYLVLWVFAGITGLMSGRASVVLMPAFYAIYILGYVYLLIDAVLIARKTNPPRNQQYELKKYNRWYVYVVYPIVWSSLIYSLALADFGRSILGFEAFRIPTGSMMPSLEIGDYITVDRRRTNFSFGDVVVFVHPEQPSVSFMKRIVGVPGDRIIYRDKKLVVNDNEVTYKKIRDVDMLGDMSIVEYLEAFGETNYKIFHNPSRESEPIEFTVPDGQYFVMGDNRDHSNDSRHLGFIPAENIRGVATYVWFSWEDMSRMGFNIKVR